MLDRADDLNQQKGAFQSANAWIQEIAEPIEFKGHFRVFDYSVSHSQLVIRHSWREGEQNLNLDLLFDGVDYIDLPVHLEDPILSAGGETDLARLAETRPSLHKSYRDVFVLESSGCRFVVVAALLKIVKSDLPPMESIVIRVDEAL
ncbi:MAG: hypothetical protein AAF170_02855 [Bacteroidota bacterium]